MNERPQGRDTVMDTASLVRRRRFEWLSPVLIVIGVVFGLVLLLKFIVFPAAQIGPRWKTIQVLRSADRQHIAQLERLYGHIDVNFLVTLDSDVIHHSADCAHKESIPFRETLAWDETANVLVFQLANETVFAYDVASRSEIDPSRYESLVLPTVTLKDIGFEGEGELRRRMQSADATVS